MMGLVSCGAEPSADEREAASIPFAVRVHDEAFRCGQTYGPIGLAGEDFTVRVTARPGGQPNFLGEFTQGPAASRFV